MGAPNPPYLGLAPRDWSLPLTKVYEETTDRILINIASHFDINDTTPTFEWQMKKLAEIGQLTDENIGIIVANTRGNPDLIRKALYDSALNALEKTEPLLKAAAEKGYLSPAGGMMTGHVGDVLQAYQLQAVKDTNLVNTVMLDSGKKACLKAINNIAMWEQQDMTANQLLRAQQILNTATGEVATGATARTTAVRRALKQMADEGLTGFVDRGGHNWSPEAYVNMDIRTAANNVANQAAFSRNQDYGNDLISVRINATARPGCYPYQGKIYSQSGRSGVTEDLNGNKIPFESLYSTTYGQPDGIFGINCHHGPPILFIPGFTLLRGEVPPQEENDKRYAESQKQRALERQVRYAKRDAMIADASHDKEMFDKAALKVKQKQAELKAFTNATGNPIRLERTQVSGYNRSVAGKATASAKAQTATSQQTGRPMGNH